MIDLLLLSFINNIIIVIIILLFVTNIMTVEILEKVELREEPYFRPDISGHDCPEPLSELIQRCWNDVPEERPGFDIMRSIVRQITR
jgi:hypothetical protein